MLVFNDYYELLALHKALIEAKFNIDPQNESIAGSPIIADICNKVVDELSSMEEDKSSGGREKWSEWRKIKVGTLRTKKFWEKRCRDLLEQGYGKDEIDIIIKDENKSQVLFTPWECALINAQKDKRWDKATEEERLEYAKCYLSPFVGTPADLNLFISTIMSVIK